MKPVMAFVLRHEGTLERTIYSSVFPKKLLAENVAKPVPRPLMARKSTFATFALAPFIPMTKPAYKSEASTCNGISGYIFPLGMFNHYPASRVIWCLRIAWNACCAHFLWCPRACSSIMHIRLHLVPSRMDCNSSRNVACAISLVLNRMVC